MSQNLQDEQKTRINLCFNSFKPVCGELITILSNTNPAVYENVDIKEIIRLIESPLNSILDFISLFNGDELTYIFEYVMIPLSLIFNPTNLPSSNTKVIQSSSKEPVIIKSLEIISKFLCKISLHSNSKFIELLKLSSLNLSNSSNNIASDELILAAIDTISSLFNQLKNSNEIFYNHLISNNNNSTSNNNNNDIYSNESFLGIGFLISTLLDLLRNSNYNNSTIKLKVIQCMASILNRMIQDNIKYFSILFQISPLILSTLVKVITIEDLKVNSKVRIEATELFTNLTVSIMNNNIDTSQLSKQMQNNYIQAQINIHNLCCFIFPTSGSYHKLSTIDSNGSVKPPTLQSLENKIHQKTSEKLLGKFLLRKALLESSNRLLVNTSTHLSSLLPIVLEVLVLLSNDEYPEIAKQSQQYLTKSNHKDIIIENFNHLFQSLPRFICKQEITSTLDEDKKILLIRLTNSYLLYLNSDISTLISARIDLVATTLLILIEMKLPVTPTEDENSTKGSIGESSLKFIGNSRLETLENTPSLSVRKQIQKSDLSKPYLYFSSEQFEHELFRMIEIIGANSEFMEWIDILLSNSSLYNSPKRKEILLVLNHLMIGIINSSRNNQFKLDQSTIQYMLDELMAPNLLNLPIQDQNQDNSGLVPISRDLEYQFQVFNDNSITLSLIIDSIGIIVQVLPANKKYNQIFISKVLYHLLEKYGSVDSESNPILISCRKTLDNIINCLNYQSLDDLIFKNSDYLLDTIENHMKYLNSFPNTPNIFQGILNITGLGFLPFLSDTVKMILHALDMAILNSESITIFIKILVNILKIIYDNARVYINYQSELKKTIYNNNNIKKESMYSDNDSEISKNNNINDIKEYFMSHHQNKDVENEQHQKDFFKKPVDVGFNDLENLKDENVPPKNFQDVTEIQRQITQQIMEKALNFISSKNRLLKISVLEIIDMSLYVLSTGRKYGSEEVDDNDPQDNVDQTKTQIQEETTTTTNVPKVALFPIIHLVWGSILKRVTESDRVISINSLKVIQTIAHLTKDFITARFWDELWPILKNLLIQEQSQKSNLISINLQMNSTKQNSNNNTNNTKLIEEIDDHSKNRKNNNYKFTPSFKIQFEILKTIESVLEFGIKVNQQQIIDIARYTLIYLNSKQAEEIQLLAIDIWKILLKKDSDTLWLLLYNLSNQYKLSPNPIEFKYSNVDEFQKNAQILFTLII
ncbi:hypothetical protein DLAC_09965 [Tieghemostelium lacteum]|uniref:Uncharacterized protein n=1 Tax=Tieghemostelium lacteum TaxID=361077 RepID=A0A151Z5S3_TIELA|nr:hypothetical protein DLAC_09965 [Tieghemostelium lacteum]|eukprot:KYQ89306.1 hypothetical protein DLAC_09965 [Tieghemostelium lacteum]